MLSRPAISRQAQVCCFRRSHPEIPVTVWINDEFLPEDAPLVTNVTWWPEQEGSIYSEQVPSALMYSNTGEVGPTSLVQIKIKRDLTYIAIVDRLWRASVHQRNDARN